MWLKTQKSLFTVTQEPFIATQELERQEYLDKVKIFKIMKLKWNGSGKLKGLKLYLLTA